MKIKTEKGRDFYQCENCRKVYSFKIGRKTDYWTRSYCKKCAEEQRAAVLNCNRDEPEW